MKPFILLSSLIFLSFHHPLIMTMMLITTTILSALFISFSTTLSWFSYVISLIMVGAMLIIFIYLASLAPNEVFPSLPFFPLLLFMSPAFIIIYLLPSSPSMNPTNFTLTIQLFSHTPLVPTLVLASFLFITMIATVKITSTPEGPLKSNN